MERTLTADEQKVLSNMMRSLSTRDGDETKGIQDAAADLSTAASAAQKAFNTAELLEMILLHLPTLDLTRALTVSKHCRDVIKTSKECRRTLFLEPEIATTFLDWRENVDQTYYLRHNNDRRRFQPVLVQEPGEGRMVVTRAHPLIETNKIIKSSFMSVDLLWKIFGRAPHQTFISQPPVTEIRITALRYDDDLVGIYGSSTLECDAGVTFGAIADEVDKLYKPAEAVYLTLYLRIMVKGSIAEDSKCVQVAKNVLADRLKAGLDHWSS